MNIEHWALNIEHWTLSGCKFNISSFILPLRMCLPATVPICTCTCICTGSYCTSGNHRSDVRLSLQYIPGDWHRLAEFFHLTIDIISMTWPIIIIILAIVAQEECSTRQSVETSRLKTSSALIFLTHCMCTFHTLCTFHTFLPHPHTFKFKCNLWKNHRNEFTAFDWMAELALEILQVALELRTDQFHTQGNTIAQSIELAHAATCLKGTVFHV